MIKINNSYKLNRTYLLIIFFINNISIAQNIEYEVLNSRGINQSENNFIEAEKEYRKAISIDTDLLQAKYNLSNSLYEKGYYSEALFNQISASKDESSPAEKHKIYHNIGNILMKQNLCKEAVEAYKNALRNNTLDDETRYNLAIATECAKDQEQNQKQSEAEDENNEKKNKDKDENKNEKDDKDKSGNDKENKNDQNENKNDQNENKNDQNENKNDEKKNRDKSDSKNNTNQNGSKLSQEQIKNLLEAMNQEENKVQQKINAKKLKGVKVKNEKDW